MTDQPTVDESIAARKAAEDELRARLADLHLDGPYDFTRGFDPLSAMFGGSRDRFAVCLTAMGSWSRDNVWQPTCCDSPWAETGYTEHGGRERRDIVHLELANPRPLVTPIPAKGRLGLWTPDAELLAAIREQVPA